MRDHGERRASEAATAPVAGEREWLVAAALIVIAVLLVFGQVVGFDFVVWDDTQHVTRNPHLHPVTWDGVAYLWSHAYANLYVPLAYTAWALLALVAGGDAVDAAAGGALDARVFHAANLVLHVVNALLVLALLRRFVRARFAAVAGALLFALHPLQVESVAWVSELRGLLSASLALAALLVFVRWDERRPPRSVGYLWSLALAAAALLAKPSAVALAPMVFAIDRWLRGGDTARSARRALPFLALALPLVVLTRSLQEVAPEVIAPPALRPVVAADAILFYVRELVAPLGLGIDHGRTPLAVADSWQAWAALGVVTVLSLLVARAGRLRPWLLAASLLFLAALLPTLGLWPFAFQGFSTVADRYAYLALTGPALALARILDGPTAKGAKAVVVAALAALGALAFAQARTWRDTTTLMTQAIAVNPRSEVSYLNRGTAEARRGQLDEAMADFDRALEINPRKYKAIENRAGVLLLRGHVDEAIAEYRRAIAIEPGWAESHANLGVALARAGDLSRAVDEYREALRLDPGSAPARTGLARALEHLSLDPR